MKCKDCGWKRSWPDLKYFAGICLENLKKITKALSEDSRSLDRDLNPGPNEYEKRVPAVRLRRFVKC
jgi:hypothetical protein